jgi:hypothetical protein
MKKIRATELGALKADSATTFAQQTAHGSPMSAIYNHHQDFLLLMEKKSDKLKIFLAYLRLNYTHNYIIMTVTK